MIPGDHILIIVFFFFKYLYKLTSLVIFVLLTVRQIKVLWLLSSEVILLKSFLHSCNWWGFSIHQQVWQLGSSAPNFTLKHERDVNCLDYHPGGDKPYIVSGEDGGTIRVWDYQVQRLNGFDSVWSHTDHWALLKTYLRYLTQMKVYPWQ